MLKKKLSRPDYLAGITAITLILLGIIQILFGELWAKSVALTANGFDCIGDGFVSATVWAGLRIYERPADDRFHFGYYKNENLASIAAAMKEKIQELDRLTIIAHPDDIDQETG